MRLLGTAQKHFRRVSFDLIYGLPGETEDSWSVTLAQALTLGTRHLSLYQLTIEPGTRFASMVARREFERLDADAAASLYELTHAMTSEAGLPAYEISNHARLRHESRHNLTYWRYGDYAGIGPGAHGRRLGLRTVRHKKPENFLAAMKRNGHGMVEEALLSSQEAADEALVMGLRLSEGIDAEAIAARFGRQSIVDWRKVDRLVASGHLKRDGGRIAPTAAGRLLLDDILAEVALDEPISAVAERLPKSAAALRRFCGAGAAADLLFRYARTHPVFLSVERTSDEIRNHHVGILVRRFLGHLVAHVELDDRALEGAQLSTAGGAYVGVVRIGTHLLARRLVAGFFQAGFERVSRPLIRPAQPPKRWPTHQSE